MTAISLVVNGRRVAGTVEPRLHLADYLRDHLNLTGTHLRCEQGACGACTLLIDGAPARSCLTYAVLCQGAAVTTIEGLEHDPIVARLREAFSAEHALQCGFCTPGMLVTARDIVRRLPDADEARIRIELSGNLCRCTGYVGIVRAIGRVLAERRAAGETASVPAPAGLGPIGSRPGLGTSAAPGTVRAVAAEIAPADGETDLGLDGRQPNLATELAIRVERPAGETWAALADIELMARCMPGATLTEPATDKHIVGEIAVKVGPIATRFRGRARLTRDEAERSGTLTGAGRDGLSGSRVRAEVGYRVVPDGDAASRVELAIRAILTGPLAQFGRSGIVDDILARIAAEFARALDASLRGEPAPAAAGETSLSMGRLLWSALLARVWGALPFRRRVDRG